MKAILCAAGQGSRLRPFTDNIPKPLVKIGEKTILEYVLNNISRCGITEVVVLVGYNSDKVKKTIGFNYKDCNIKYYVNEDYKNTENMDTLWLARKEVNEGFILLNADVLFHAELLKRLLNCPYPNVIVVDDRIKIDEHSMKVRIENEKLVAIGRNLKNSNGRAIGMYKFSIEGGKKYFKEIEKLVNSGKKGFQIEAPLENFIKHIDIHSIKAGNLPWIEIDTSNDLLEAQNKIKFIANDN